MVAATAGFCCYCIRSSPAVHKLESMAARLAPTQRGAFSAVISAGLLKPLSSLWLANSPSNSSSLSSRRGLFEEHRFSPLWALSSAGAVASRRPYHREGDRGRPNSQVAEAYEQQGEPQQQQQQQQESQQLQQQPQQETGSLPVPPVIKWEKDLANAVQLIGRVGRDTELKYLDSGKVVATSSLAVNKTGRNEDPSWFYLEFWDELAEAAAHHVAKGEQLFVTGRIVVDKRIKDNITYTLVKVVVRDFCFVEPFTDRRQPYAPSNAEGGSIDSSQRSWSPQQSSGQPSDGTAGQRGSSSNNNEVALATEKRWQEYFADPSQWWDNREKKRNPKAPDFKHKSTNEALWVTSWNNPPWVEQQLAALDEKKGSEEKNLSSF